MCVQYLLVHIAAWDSLDLGTCMENPLLNHKTISNDGTYSLVSLNASHTFCAMIDASMHCNTICHYKYSTTIMILSSYSI